MSLAQFEDVFEICCEFMALDEKERIDRVKKDRLEVREDRRPVGYEWWEVAIDEIEKERKLLNV
ncbi:hypothetical protein M670_02160 [Schinkia azotoformans MEV2011]|uniref:Uncharacterized protein n=2 Tax=Schinkia azotoformans TaxID=1454 RepID=K6DFX9_SCHAZ|nr:hypothetical protein [Schinkia azotoformans]EKN67234.1 hypothetical protein BAZO_09921 [Schinkia azotoformans LMG 9581]KEF38534.1 hypothetical protein M670_02160 [Schinkia azotoformans MEV2011]MEC1639926.1 hypothetical protein [Schinkia azotoformans]MEC1695143.1 hypothetical protein [Schinkia azotoformans]MEC1717612.1 hypothetical protein [Schinkia azotoformans]